MPSPKSSYALPSDDPCSVVREDHIESGFIKKLQGLKYEYRPDINADAKFMNERDDIAEYIGTLKADEGLSETAIREGYTRFKAEKNRKELAAIAARHGLATATLQPFVDSILNRMICNGDQLSDLLAPLDLGWKARTQAELALMAELVPLLIKRAGGRDISGLSAYDQ